jgi:4-diphosphocytidyl-2-C-methyl-D-erythritol kinase
LVGGANDFILAHRTLPYSMQWETANSMLGKRTSEGTVVLGAPAKVNLFLRVLNRRPDGYHNIQSLFQAVSLFDRLIVRRVSEPGISLAVSGSVPRLETVPADQSNLVCRAFEAVSSVRDLSGGLHVELEKNIPVAAGLGGGSSDAAATIEAIDALFDLELSFSDKAEIGSRVGSDVPFFFTGGQALAEGRGEVLTETNYARDYWLRLVTIGRSISTSEAYASLKRALTNPKNEFSLPSCQTVEELVEALRLSGNDFEEALLSNHPELESIKDGLLRSGARLARLSGSGPTMFGLFDEPPDINENGFKSRGDWRISTVWPIALPTSSAV